MSDDQWTKGQGAADATPATWTTAPSSVDRSFPTSPSRRTVGRQPDAPTTPVSRACGSVPTTPVRCPTGRRHRRERSRVSARRAEWCAAGDDDSDDVDVWSTFTTESPVWRDDDPVTTVMDQVAREPDASGASDRSGGTARRADPSGGYDRPVDSSGSGEFDLPESDYGRYGSGYGPSTGEVARSARNPTG